MTQATQESSAERGAPGDRATTFQPVQGPQAEHYSGEVLLVSAYAILWVILFAWIALLWRKSSRLDSRLDELERVIDRAAEAKDAP
jgi:CcmD family protein